MNLFEAGVADSDDSKYRTHAAAPRLIVSLLVAFFAYLGLALGGGINPAARAETNSFASGRNSQPQPLYLTLRDTMRGIITAERKPVHKPDWPDSGPAAMAPAAAMLPTDAPCPAWRVQSRSVSATVFKPYGARAPPLALT